MLDTVKQKSLLYILRKYEHDPDHSNQVKKLALALFDKTRGELHDFDDKERDLLEAGAMYFMMSDILLLQKTTINILPNNKKRKPEVFTDEE